MNYGTIQKLIQTPTVSNALEYDPEINAVALSSIEVTIGHCPSLLIEKMLA